MEPEERPPEVDEAEDEVPPEVDPRSEAEEAAEAGSRPGVRPGEEEDEVDREGSRPGVDRPTGDSLDEDEDSRRTRAVGASANVGPSFSVSFSACWFRSFVSFFSFVPPCVGNSSLSRIFPSIG